MLKVLELYGGIGSPRQAIKNLGIEHKLIDYVEWWEYAFNTYYMLHDHGNHPQSVIGWNLDVDLLVHGSPCQDFSQAGKNDLSTGRSILYLETLRIIEEELNPKPKYIVWENVKGLINKKNRPHFEHYLKRMEQMGYVNHWKVINSKDFGIPQSRNRVFVVSILKSLNQDFNWDNLRTRPMKPLKDFLEENVPDSYYIRQKSMVKAIQQGKIKIIDNVCETITTKQLRWNNSGAVKIPFTNFNAENVVNNIEGYCQTITASGAQSRIKVAIPIDGESWFYDKKHKTSIPLQNFISNNRIIDSENGVVPTITAAHGETPFRIGVPILKAESIDFTNFKTLPRESDGKVINGSYNRYWKTDKYVGTIAASKQEKILENIDETTKLKKDVPIFIIDEKPYYLRILTERECWRLMGWQDKDIDKIIHLPKTKLYHMAGNAIVIQVLEAIFEELLGVDNEKQE